MKTDGERKANGAARLGELKSVTIMITRVSASGMTRWLRVLGCSGPDGQIDDYTLAAAALLERKVTDAGELKLGGCGYDARYHLGEDIQRALGRKIEINKL